MPLGNVGVDGVVQASTQNALINNVNASPGWQILTSSGVLTIPEGIYRIKVTLCGGGGGNWVGEYTNLGGVSPIVSKIFDVEPGASYNVTVGAAGTAGLGFINGGAGGNSSFSTLSSNGGGGASSVGAGSAGTATGYDIRHGANLFLTSSGDGYGSPGIQGVCVIEY